MAKTIRELMTKHPLTLKRNATVAEAARAMKDNDIGDVLVEEKGELCGICTDRDIVVRVIAQGLDPKKTKLSDVCSSTVTTAKPDSPIEEVIEMMRRRNVRRVPVVENDVPVGIVSLGDLAVERDRHSVLGSISAAPAST